jgi:chemotaxis protein MotB
MKTNFKNVIVTSVFSASLLITSCVPSKKYNELVEKEKTCAEELAKYKSLAIENEAKTKDLTVMSKQLQSELGELKKEHDVLSAEHRALKAEYDKAVELALILERKFDENRSLSTKQTAKLQAELEAKTLEVQRKEDALRELEAELIEKQRLVELREARVNELEELISKKDEAVKALKERVAKALLGFEGKGLTVEEKNGKVYVSLEAKLLFASGSTKVEKEGQQALIELAKVLETTEDIEIIVEGHTDTDRLASAAHPKNNWELSVLRATSVIDIMLTNSKVSPKIFMAAGRSMHHPVGDDKAKNRRIEVIIAPNLDQLFSILNADN